MSQGTWRAGLMFNEEDKAYQPEDGHKNAVEADVANTVKYHQSKSAKHSHHAKPAGRWNALAAAELRNERHTDGKAVENEQDKTDIKEVDSVICRQKHEKREQAGDDERPDLRALHGDFLPSDDQNRRQQYRADCIARGEKKEQRCPFIQRHLGGVRDKGETYRREDDA